MLLYDHVCLDTLFMENVVHYGSIITKYYTINIPTMKTGCVSKYHSFGSEI